MNTITIPKKEYEKLIEIRKRFAAAYKAVLTEKVRRNMFSEGAFGILKDGFGKKSSGAYMAKLRKSWRK